MKWLDWAHRSSVVERASAGLVNQGRSRPYSRTLPSKPSMNGFLFGSPVWIKGSLISVYVDHKDAALQVSSWRL